MFEGIETDDRLICMVSPKRSSAGIAAVCLYTARASWSASKTIYSLNPDLRQLLAAANQRYLAFISALDLPVAGINDLNKISAPVRENSRPYRGFNLFHAADLLLFEVLSRGEFAISGLRNRDLRAHIPGSTTHQISRSLKRLRLHGIVKRIPGTFKYYLTELGRRIVIGSLALKNMAIVPAIARAAAA